MRDNAELRELGSAAETEAAASALEDAQLRVLSLTMNDALDDGQRRTVVRFLADQLERVRDGAVARVAAWSVFELFTQQIEQRYLLNCA